MTQLVNAYMVTSHRGDSTLTYVTLDRTQAVEYAVKMSGVIDRLGTEAVDDAAKPVAYLVMFKRGEDVARFITLDPASAQSRADMFNGIILNLFV